MRGCCFLLNYIYKNILLHNTKLIQLHLTLRQLAIFRLLLTTLYAGNTYWKGRRFVCNVLISYTICAQFHSSRLFEYINKKILEKIF